MLRTLLPAALAALCALAPCADSSWAAPAPSGGAADPVRIESGDELAIFGEYWAPRGAKGKAEGVILLHAPGRDRSQLADLAQVLQRKKMAVLTLDLRGHGESATEEESWEELDEEARRNLWTYALRDVETAARWLRAKEEVHSSALSLVGCGASSALAAHYAVSDAGVRSLLFVEPFVEDQLGYELARSLPELEGLPMRAVVAKSASKSARAQLEELGAEGFVQLEVVKADAGELLGESRCVRGAGDWISEPVVRADVRSSARGR